VSPAMGDTFSLLLLAEFIAWFADTVDGYRGFLIPVFCASPLLLLLTLLQSLELVVMTQQYFR